MRKAIVAIIVGSMLILALALPASAACPLSNGLASIVRSNSAGACRTGACPTTANRACPTGNCNTGTCADRSSCTNGSCLTGGTNNALSQLLRTSGKNCNLSQLFSLFGNFGK